MRLAIYLLPWLLVFNASCRARNPDAAGMISEPSAYTGPEVPKGGEWTVTCASAEGDGSHHSFILEVQGALSQTDEGQDLLVSAIKTGDGNATEVLADHEQGHGALAPAGSVFLGFMSGVLTAIPQAGIQPATHSGVLTLAKDPNVEGLKVSCQLNKKA